MKIHQYSNYTNVFRLSYMREFPNFLLCNILWDYGCDGCA
jgi:hypothetical protein